MIFLLIIGSFRCFVLFFFLHGIIAKYLVDDEFVGAIRQRPAVLLHQRDERVAEKLLLPLVFGCGTTTTRVTTTLHKVKKKIHKDTPCDTDTVSGGKKERKGIRVAFGLGDVHWRRERR